MTEQCAFCSAKIRKGIKQHELCNRCSFLIKKAEKEETLDYLFDS